jgi:Ring finger domain
VIGLIRMMKLSIMTGILCLSVLSAKNVVAIGVDFSPHEELLQVLKDEVGCEKVCQLFTEAMSFAQASKDVVCQRVAWTSVMDAITMVCAKDTSLIAQTRKTLGKMYALCRAEIKEIDCVLEAAAAKRRWRVGVGVGIALGALSWYALHTYNKKKQQGIEKKSSKKSLSLPRVRSRSKPIKKPLSQREELINQGYQQTIQNSFELERPQVLIDGAYYREFHAVWIDDEGGVVYEIAFTEPIDVRELPLDQVCSPSPDGPQSRLFTHAADNPDCVICMENLQGKRAVHCGHACHVLYHDACLEGWRANRNTCPSCRQSFIYPLHWIDAP